MTSTSEHDELQGLAALYVLGALTPSERAAFEAHLATCNDCADEARTFAAVPDALGLAAPQVSPSPALRERVLRSVGALQGAPAGQEGGRPDERDTSQAAVPRRPAAVSLRFAMAPWLAMAASVMLAAASVVYAWQLRDRIGDLEVRLRTALAQAEANDRQIAQARLAVADAEARLAVLVAPDVTRVDLAGQTTAPGASGRAYWSRSRGLMFTASQLPMPPPGRMYQLWMLAGSNPPISNRWMLALDPAGVAVAVFDTPPDVPQPTGVAVSLEPDGGAAAPTGALYLVGLIGRP